MNNVPVFVVELEAAFGAPSQAGFGSAVFYEATIAAADLEQVAQAKYRFFVGDLWDRFGSAAWLNTWRLLYTRSYQRRDIASELLAITDRDARQLAALIIRFVVQLKGSAFPCKLAAWLLTKNSPATQMLRRV